MSNQHEPDLPHQLSESKPLSRRDFIDWIIRGGLVTTLVGMILPALAYLWPATRRGPALHMKKVGRLDDIPIWGAAKVVFQGSPLLMVRTPKDLRVFSAICTHLGCVVAWDDQKKEIACPCHAGFFDVDGRVISGPPPRPLVSHPVSIVNGEIFIKA